MADHWIDLPAKGGGAAAGVESLNGADGALTLIPGDGIEISVFGTEITISAELSGLPDKYAGFNSSGELTGLEGIGYEDGITSFTGLSVEKQLPDTITGNIVGIQSQPNINNLAGDNFFAFTAFPNIGHTDPTTLNNIYGFSFAPIMNVALTASSVSGFRDTAQLLDGTSLDNYSSITVNPSVNTHLSNFTGLNIYPNFDVLSDIDSYQSISVSNHFSAGSILDSYAAMNINGNIDATGINGFRGIAMYHDIGADAAVSINNHIDMQIGPHYYDGSDLGSYNGLQLSPSFDSGSTVGNVALVSTNMQMNAATGAYMVGFLSNNTFGNTGSPSSITQYQEANFNSNFGADATIGDYYGMVIRPNSSAGASITSSATFLDLGNNSPLDVGGNVVGINVNLNNMVSTNQKIGLSINGGSINVASDINTSVVGISGFFSNNNLGGGLIIADGDPIVATPGFGNNLGISVQFDDNSTADNFLGSSSLGFSINGFVNAVIGAAGKTFDTMNYMMAGGSNSGSGTITNLNVFRAIGLVSPGNAIVNEVQFLADAGVDGGAPTNLWGFRADSPNADNWFNKNLVIGGATMKPSNADIGLEIASKKAFQLGILTTTEKLALTPLEGMMVFDTTLKQVSYYNGTSWVNI